MTDQALTTLLSGGSFFEGPRWHDGSWWVSDFYRRTVSRVSTDGVETIVVERVEGQPSGIGWLPDGQLVISSMKDQRLLRFDGNQLTTHAELGHVSGGYLNDLVVDHAGRVYVGDFGFDLMGGGAPAPGNLKRVDPDGTITVVAEDLQFPNGAVITPGGSTLIVGETFGNRYTAFDITHDGALDNRRTWAPLGPEVTGATVPEVMGQLTFAPDGCALDSGGHIWSADALGGRVARIAPGGEIVEQIAAPEGLGVYACALGGPDGNTLLMCCAPDFDEHRRTPVREAILVTTQVEATAA